MWLDPRRRVTAANAETPPHRVEGTSHSPLHPETIRSRALQSGLSDAPTSVGPTTKGGVAAFRARLGELDPAVCRLKLALLRGDHDTAARMLAERTPAERLALDRSHRALYDAPLTDALDEDLLGIYRGDDPTLDGIGDLGPYQARAIKADAASGSKLRLMAMLAKGWLVGGLVRNEILKQTGLRDFADLEVPKLQSLGTSVMDPIPPSQRELTTSLSRRYAQGDIDPVQVAERFLAEVKINDLNAVTAVDEADVMAQAVAARDRWAAGKPLGPLDGVPVVVKEQLDVAGYGTTVGTRVHGKAPADKDAAVIKNLREAGALIVGKTNMHELGLGVTGSNPHHGAVRNPYDPSRVAGGSSGGSAAAVGADLVPIAVASDAGGSTRIPAAFCGLVGLKPTQGQLDPAGNYPLAPSLQSSGPIAQTAEEAAVAYAAMAGNVNLGDLDDRDLSGVTVGVITPWNEHADPALVEATQQTIDHLVGLGATVREVDVPGLSQSQRAQMILYAAHLRETEAESRKRFGDRKYSAEARLSFALADALTEKEIGQAERVRALIGNGFEKAFESCDIILSPATGMTAPPLPKNADKTGASDLGQLAAINRFAAPANLSGHPAITWSAGKDDDGLPLGVQAIGRNGSESLLLRLANVANP